MPLGTSNQYQAYDAVADQYVMQTPGTSGGLLDMATADGRYVRKDTPVAQTMAGALTLPADGFTVGTNQIKASGGKVGIGRTPGTYALEVQGDVMATGFVRGDGSQLSNVVAVNATAYKGNAAPTATEFSYLSGVTSGIQAQINAKLANAYAAVSDGTTVASASAGDTLRVRSGGIVTVAVGSNDATFGDNILISASVPFATPTASVGLSAIAGSSASAMRADAAPALNVSISPAWTGTHTFQSAKIITPDIGANNTQRHSVPAVASDTLALLAASQAFTNKTYNGLTISTTTGVLNISALKTLAVQNSITLAGSADGFTVTFPASGTTAMGAATLTVATTNNASVANHTHAITSSSAPGAAASVLASDAAGGLTLVNLFTTGHAGVGTTNPDVVGFGAIVGAAVRVLTINSANQRSVLELVNTNTSTAGIAGQITFNNGATQLASILTAADGATNKGALIFYMNAGAGLIEAARITNAGALGLGTTNPGTWKLYVNGSVRADSDLLLGASTANLFLKDTSTGLQSASSTVVTLQNNNAFRTTNFASGVSGWGLDAAGTAEFQNIIARGEFHASVFSYAEIHVTAGTNITCYSGGTLLNDCTTVNSPASFFLDLKDPVSGHAPLFRVGDTLRLKAFSLTTTGSINGINDNFLLISAVTNMTTFYRYTCTKLSGSPATFRAGTAVEDYGVAGDGWLSLSADGTIGSSPNLTMAINTSAINTASAASAFALACRIGNLNGSYGYATAVYGFGTGVYGVTNSSWITVDQTSGLRIGRNTSVLAQWDIAGTITIGQVAAGQSNILISSGALDMRVNTSVRIHFASDGSGYVANNNISWDTAGNAIIAGWNVTSTYLKNSTTYLASGFDIPAGQVTWIGQSASGYQGFSMRDASNRFVQIIGNSGTIYPNFQVFDGTRWRIVLGGLNNAWGADGVTDSMGMKIWDASGNKLVEFSSVQNVIAGWNITGASISSGGLVLAASSTPASNKIYIGTGTYGNINTAFYVDGSGRFSLADKLTWDGSTLAITGTVTATAGTIGGWTINSAALSSGGIILAASAVTTSNKIYIGTGIYANANTAVYIDGSGRFSLKDRLTFDGTTLTIVGNGTFSGALSGATGTFAGSLSAATGTFAGSLSAATGSFSGNVTASSGGFTGTIQISSATGALAIGTTPPTSASSGTGIWVGRDGLYVLNTGTLTALLSTVNGSVSLSAVGSVADSVYVQAYGKASAVNGSFTAEAVSFNNSQSARLLITTNQVGAFSYAALYSSAGTFSGLGVGTNSPSARLHVAGNTIRLDTARTPATSGAAGNVGDICWDANYVYVCVASGQWKRAALSTW